MPRTVSTRFPTVMAAVIAIRRQRRPCAASRPKVDGVSFSPSSVRCTTRRKSHHSSNCDFGEDKDIPQLRKMSEQMKTHGALAGIQLAYSGINGPNLYTKEVPLAPTALPIRTFTNDPVQARALDKQDIKDLRRWFVNAAKRSKEAGFDLICLYGAHGFGIFQHFLSRATNQRGDEYGGSLENRSRFSQEVIADMRDAVGDTMAITLRVSRWMKPSVNSAFPMPRFATMSR